MLGYLPAAGRVQHPNYRVAYRLGWVGLAGPCLCRTGRYVQSADMLADHNTALARRLVGHLYLLPGRMLSQIVVRIPCCGHVHESTYW